MAVPRVSSMCFNKFLCVCSCSCSAWETNLNSKQLIKANVERQHCSQPWRADELKYLWTFSSSCVIHPARAQHRPIERIQRNMHICKLSVKFSGLDLNSKGRCRKQISIRLPKVIAWHGWGNSSGTTACLPWSYKATIHARTIIIIINNISANWIVRLLAGYFASWCK